MDLWERGGRGREAGGEGGGRREEGGRFTITIYGGAFEVLPSVGSRGVVAGVGGGLIEIVC
jgi:hypothetical protein